MKGSLLRFMTTLIAAQGTFMFLHGVTKLRPSQQPYQDVATSTAKTATATTTTTIVANAKPSPTSLLRSGIPKNVNEMLQQFETPNATETRRVFLAHVGKAGGETIRASMRINCKFLGNKRARQKCWQHLYDAFYGPNVKIPGEPQLSRITTGFHHYLDLKPKNENLEATHFLFCIRHPLERFASWFRYVAPANCANVPDRVVAASCRVKVEIAKDPTLFQAKFFKCFPTMDTVPIALQKIRSGNYRAFENNQTAVQCANMLVDTIQGKTGTHMAGHMIANYQFYHHFTLGNSPLRPFGKMRNERNRGNGHERKVPVFVIRTPHLWDDMQTVDRMLGGNGYFSQAGLQISHQSESFTDHANIDPHQALVVCCVLADEMAIYKELLERAVNLNQSQRQETLNEALKICQVTSWDELIQKCNLQDDADSLLHRPPFSPIPTV